MNKHLKKVISLVLALILVLPPLAASASAGNYDEKPTIYVTGSQTNELYNADGTLLYPKDTSMAGDVIKEALKPCLEKLVVGLLTDNYEAYAKEFYDAFMEIYGGLALDENGEVSDGSHAKHTIYNANIPKKTSGYGLWDYRFWYDWRISPIAVAEELKIYIDMVKVATDESKVNLMGRCYGANVVQAYLAYYPEHAAANVDDIAYLSSSVEGIDMLGAIFAGEIYLEDQAITNFVNWFMENNELIKDEATYTLVLATVEFLNQITVLGLTGDTLELLIDRLESSLIPLILRDFLGSMPSYWAMVPAELYEQARAFIFNGVEDTYKGLIEKNDAYYYNVQLKAKETLLDLDAKGIDFYIVSKYNFPDYPVYKNATALSDGNTTVVRQSFGATCADYGEVLSDKYISSLSDTKYLSPDHKIDASTCLFPETSYFLKDLHHDAFHLLDQWTMQLMNNDATVSGGEYAQYRLYDASGIKEIEGLDEDGTTEKAPSQMIFIRFFTAIINFINKLLKGEIDFSNMFGEFDL